MITLFNDKIQTSLYSTLAFKFDGKTQEVEELKRKICMKIFL